MESRVLGSDMRFKGEIRPFLTHLPVDRGQFFLLTALVNLDQQGDELKNGRSSPLIYYCHTSYLCVIIHVISALCFSGRSVCTCVLVHLSYMLQAARREFSSPRHASNFF